MCKNYGRKRKKYKKKKMKITDKKKWKNIWRIANPLENL